MVISRARIVEAALVAAACVRGVLGTDILQTTGFSSCNTAADIQVQKVDIEYNNDNKTVTFNVLGTSNKVQNVTAVLNVTAYGTNVYSNSFDPCASNTFVEQLCPGKRSLRAFALFPMRNLTNYLSAGGNFWRERHSGNT